MRCGGLRSEHGQNGQRPQPSVIGLVDDSCSPIPVKPGTLRGPRRRRQEACVDALILSAAMRVRSKFRPRSHDGAGPSRRFARAPLAGAETWRSAHSPSARTIGSSSIPRSVSEYWTRTGGPDTTTRKTMCSRSSSRSRSVSNRSESPGIVDSSSLNRRGPPHSARTIAPVHRRPISSTAW